MSITSIAEPVVDTSQDPAALVPAIAVHGVSHAYGTRKALEDVTHRASPRCSV